MQVVRTILWFLLALAVLGFTWLNWDKEVTVRIWDGIVWDTRIPAVVIVSFALGLLPMWLFHRGVKWRLNRRIKTLENAARATAVSPPVKSTPASDELTPSPEPTPTPTSTPTPTPNPTPPPTPEPSPKTDKP